MKKKKSHKRSLTKQTFQKRVIKQNESALRSYGVFRKTAEQIDAVKRATGKKTTYRSSYTSTSNSEVNLRGIGSTQNFQVNSRLARVS